MLSDWIANIRFWYAKNFIKHNKHYEFMLDMSDTDAMAVRFLKKYSGVIVEYSKIHMSGDTEMSFEFNIIANPGLYNTNTQRFINFANDVFRSIIHNSVEYAKEHNENRNTSAVKFDAERSLYEESVTVSEERIPERKPRKKTVRGNKRVRAEVQQSAADSSVGDQP